jgi:hypothetical protein
MFIFDTFCIRCQNILTGNEKLLEKQFCCDKQIQVVFCAVCQKWYIISKNDRPNE